MKRLMLICIQLSGVLVVFGAQAQQQRNAPVDYGATIISTETKKGSSVLAAGNPCGGASTAPALVTIQTAGPEQFVVRVIDQPVLDQMIDICQGLLPQMIVVGDLLAGNGGYNRDPLNGDSWSWRLDENSIVLAEMTIELCDATPSMVEADLPYWLGTVGNFCPWTSQIVAIMPSIPCSGDIAPPGSPVGNGVVNIDDLVAVLNVFGPCSAPPASCDADITPAGGNGVVNIDDLVAVLNAFGPCP